MVVVVCQLFTKTVDFRDIKILVPSRLTQVVGLKMQEQGSIPRLSEIR
jgi:hypothetical protein